MKGFNDTHLQKATDHTVLMVYNTSIVTKIFTFQLPGWCDLLLSCCDHSSILNYEKKLTIRACPNRLQD